MGVCCTTYRERTNLIPGALIQHSDIQGPSKKDSKIQLDILNYYKFIRVCGCGQYGTVREAVRNTSQLQKKVTPGNIRSASFQMQESFAVKSILKARVRDSFDMLKQEINTLRMSDHPNIVKLHEIFEDAKYIHLVMEMCTGGDLMDYILEQKGITEYKAAQIMKKLLHAVNHCHTLNICHRDLKPANILLSCPGGEADVKIVDFGVAKYSQTPMTEFIGTPYYLAPEVFTGIYGRECDIWSLGVMLYFMLVLRHPFTGKNLEDLRVKIIQGTFNFDERAEDPIKWSSVSPDVKDLINRMLVIDARQRISIAEALDHPWFYQTRQRKKLITKTLVDNMSNFKEGGKMRKEILNFIIRHLRENEIKNLSEVFTSMDRDKTGHITADDILYALSQQSVPQKQLDIISRKLKQAKGKKLKYTDFIAVAYDTRKLVDEENLWVAFNLFDENNDGLITIKEFQNALESTGSFLEQDEIEEVLLEFKMQADEMMDFDKFKEIMSCKFYSVFLEESPNISIIGPNTSQRRKLSIRQRLSYIQLAEDATKSDR